ncbi:AAA family ATPase [Sphingobacterium siyangense]|uniref:AAA family ATPase n=1 Tax=Sphingobacterium siyangense TaxID=459529 RepID=UPI003DA5192F
MIEQLRLFQFKGFKNQVFNFKNLTLLAGMNGMGKSSVIQALLILRNSYDRGELQQGKAITIEDRELVNLVSPDDMLHIDAESNEVSILLINEDSLGFWSVKAEGVENTLPLFSIKKEGDVFGASLFKTSFQYLNAERIGPRISYDRLKVNRLHSPLGYRGEFTANKLSQLVTELAEVVHPQLSLSNGEFIYDQVSDWVSKIIYPGTRVSLDESNPNHISIQYNFNRHKNKSFNPVNIGFGFSFALPIIIAVLTAKKESLLIIENPEAHLHPKGQVEMGKFLALAAEAGVQIVIETHSDHILNGIRISVKDKMVSSESMGVIFVGSYEDGDRERIFVTEPIIDEDGRIDDWPKDFFDTWEYSMMNLL